METEYSPKEERLKQRILRRLDSFSRRDKVAPRMQTQSYGSYVSASEIAKSNARFLARVYGWMASGVALTAILAYFTATQDVFMETLITNKPLFYGLLIAEFICVLSFSAIAARVSATVAGLLYFFYAGLTGITLSVIFLAYTQSSIAQVFGVTAISFGGLSAFGALTKKDLGPVGSFCMMGLFGLIGYSLLSLFFPSLGGGTAGMVYSIAGVLIFAGLTAYDTQKIKSMNAPDLEGTEQGSKLAIHGALVLYLDFINLFLKLLRLFGRRK